MKQLFHEDCKRSQAHQQGYALLCAKVRFRGFVFSDFRPPGQPKSYTSNPLQRTTYFNQGMLQQASSHLGFRIQARTITITYTVSAFQSFPHQRRRFNPEWARLSFIPSSAENHGQGGTLTICQHGSRVSGPGPYKVW